MELDSELYGLFARSEDIHWWFIGRRRIIFSFLGRLVSPPGRAAILEVGCGTGTTLKHLENYGEAVGIDISERAVAYCRERGCRDVRLTGETLIPFPDGSFDCLLSLDVIEHIEDDLAALVEYRRVLAPGGALFLTVPAFNWIWSCHDDANRHRRRYTRPQLLRRLKEAGFRVDRSSYFSAFLFPLIASSRILVRLIDRVYRLRERNLDFHIPSRPFNRLLAGIFSAEAAWLRRADLPFGSSILAACRAPGQPIIYPDRTPESTCGGGAAFSGRT